MKPLRIAYMLEDTRISGGARVIAAQADALISRGHRATIVTRSGPMTWRSSTAEWQYVSDWIEIDPSAFDFVVGTFWTTVPHAYAIAGAKAIHLCQGYEGAFDAYADIKDEIDAVYRLPVPKITVSPHLVAICRAFSDDVTYAGQIVDDIFFRQPNFADRGALRVLLAGPLLKGIGVGYEIATRARRDRAQFDLVRVSESAPHSNEPAHLATEFHVGLDTRRMAEVIASCDVALCPMRSQEGFGLPAAESMASVLATVLSEIPSFLSFDGAHDYALFAPEDDVRAMASNLERLTSDASLRRRIALRGRQVVEQFRAHHTALRLEQYFAGRRTR
ncbi:MAG TPA: glycosyltransferase family 4 protein [Thermoanaerobaculia bacterium]|nr:glycosyltransferase family 4 protein [Thermoanaerobaculia bacterium]